VIDRQANTESLEQALAQEQGCRPYILRLYVTGMTPRSAEAIATITTLCEGRLKGRYDLQVIDIYQNPVLARDEQIVAVPTLIKQLPSPMRRLIGNLCDEERVLMGLDLRPVQTEADK
jgi:circadian clock protein KaiB